MQFLDDSLLPENQQPLVIQVAPYGPEFLPGDSATTSRSRWPSRCRRRWTAGTPAPPCCTCTCREADGKGSKRLSHVQRDAGAPARGGAADAAAGRRLDLVRAGGRGREAKWLERRHAPHAGRADAQARPGDDRHQHQPDECLRADERRRRGRHLAGAAGLPAGLHRDDHPLGPGLRGRAPAAAAGCGIQPHFMLGDAGPARDRRAADPPRRLHRPAGAELGRHRRWRRRPQPLQHDGVRAPRAARCGADHRGHHAQRAAAEHDGHRDGPARALRHRGQPVGPQGRAHDQRAAGRTAGAHRAGAAPRGGHRRAGAAIYRIGEHYRSADETLARLGYAPNRPAGERGAPLRLAA
jgi:hypothetical protein